MTDFYPIYEVKSVSLTEGHETGQVMAVEQRQSEQMGSKRKFWFCDSQTSRWYLFKYSRENTGEHWSEKVACELAGLLGLPHARVELAMHEGAAGVLVEDLRSDREAMSLLHGNELLLEVDPAYPFQRTYRVSEHTLTRVSQALDTHHVELPDSSMAPRELPTGVDDALGLFVGYLLLDAIIGNTDRHHENWAVVARRSASGSRILQLAATYDHASSLGRELRDAKRIARLQGDGAHGVQGYADRARSALYRSAGDETPLSPRAAFLAVGELRPVARDAWLSRGAEVGADAFQGPLGRVPPSCVSEPAVAFAQALLRYNCAMLFGFHAESS